MGEIADMMLDGTLCEGCGCALHGNGDGIPRRCKSCRKEDTAARHEAHQAAAKRAKCPHCSRKVKLVGLQDHIRDAHGSASAEAMVRAAAPELLEATQEFLLALDALDNREYAGINGEPYDVLMRRRNAARRDLDAALAKATGSAA